MDRGQEGRSSRLTAWQWTRIAFFALFFVLFVSAVTAETGPEEVDFHCNSLAAARAAGDPELLEHMLDAGYCKYFVADYGFTARGDLTFVEDIEGTDKSVWFVDFANGTWTYTVR